MQCSPRNTSETAKQRARHAPFFHSGDDLIQILLGTMADAPIR
jgi:hypothetical protein